MQSSDFISSKEIVAEAASNIDDEGYKKCGYSFYLNAVHRATEALSIDTFYRIVTKDIYNWNSCKDSTIQIPSNLFNIREMYLFNQTCEKCDTEGVKCGCENGEESNNIWGTQIDNKSKWGNFAIVHWKRLFNKFGSSGIETARVGLNRDRVLGTGPLSIGAGLGLGYGVSAKSLIYCGIQENVICFPEHACHYKNLRIVANGFASDNEELPVIPRLAREAIVDKVCEKVLYKLKNKDRTYRIDWMDAAQKCNRGTGQPSDPGSWILATRRLRIIDTFQKQEMLDYFAGIDCK